MENENKLPLYFQIVYKIKQPTKISYIQSKIENATY